MEKSSKVTKYFIDLSLSIHRGLPKREWDWQATILTVVLVQLAATRLAMSEWVPFLRVVILLSFYAVSLGLIIGYSSLTRRNAIWVGIEYGLLLIPMQLLKTIERTEFLYMDLRGLLIRLFDTLVFLAQNQPAYDTLFFLTLASIGFWIIGVHAGYQLSRHGNFLKVAIPSGLAMLIIQIYDPWVSLRAWALAFYIFFALTLLGRLYFLENINSWKTKRVFRTSDSEWDILRSAITFAAIAVVISWSLPGLISGIEPATQAWEDFSQPIFDKFTNAVSALDSPYAEKAAGGDFYGDELSIGQHAAVGDTPVFTVEVKENEFAPIRNYWKGRVYDYYLNGQWSTVSNSSDLFLPAIDELIVEHQDIRHEMKFTFTSSVRNQRLLYTPAETIWVSKEANIISTPISAEVKDITAWVATTSFSSGNKYKVRALIADPSIEELRSSGAEYPDWVTDRYLQVPEDIAPQLNKLAMEITAPYDTVYDKVQAVTAYLRKEIEYDTKITDIPPENQDPVLWVLFDYKKGFCMYYASAETLMLRSIGIPARMAVGFVEGAYDELEEQYVVTYKDSHAWPEVYFPGIGWVEFEPTSNQFPIQRPETKNITIDETKSDPNAAGDLAIIPQGSLPLQEQSELSLNEEAAADRTNLYRNILIFALIIILTIGFGIFIIHRHSLEDSLPAYLASKYMQRGNVPPRWLNRWIRWTNLSPIERAFQAVNLSLFWLGHPQPAHITSQKRAEILVKHLPSAQDQTMSLLQEYHTTIYTLREGNVAAARRAALAIILKTWHFRVKETLQFLDTRYNRFR